MKRRRKNELNNLNNELMFTNKYLFRLLWPLFVEQLLVFAVGLIDSVMVASVGEAAVSAVSLVDSLMVLIITIMVSLATGGAVVVGQFLGQKKYEDARNAGNQLILFIVALSIVIIALLYIFKNGILSLVFGQIDNDVMNYCNTYFLIVVASVPFIAVYNAGAALFRSIGNSKVSMKISFLMNGINVAGNAILIFGFHMGVEGVAIPTLVSRVVAAVIIYIFLKNPKWDIHLSRHFNFRPDWMLIKKILRIGIPNGIENSMFQMGKLILLSLVSTFGTVSIAANAVGNAVSMIAILPGMAVGYGMISVISMCVGKGDYEQVRYYTKKLIKWAYGFMLFSNVAILLCIPGIMYLYGLSDETAALATKLIVFHSICSIVVWVPSFDMPYMLRASNDVMFTMIIGISSMGLFRVCAGFLLAYVLGMGVFGVWVAMVIDWIVRGICFVLRYKSGRWKHHAAS